MEAFKRGCASATVDGRVGSALHLKRGQVAAAGMVVGAGWAGARAFTPTAGPGISLMQEFIGLAYYTEIPAVFFDVQRVGPSTGMPTRTQQGDVMSLAYASHGDTKHIVLFPANPEECFTLAVRAFDLAERFQTPVFVASDLDIGMNDWMCRRLEWDDSYRPDRGKVLGAEDLDRIGRFSRYMGENGDAVAARTLPGVDARGAYFTQVRQRVHAGYRGAPTLGGLAPWGQAQAGRRAAPTSHRTARRRSDGGVIAIGSCDAAFRGGR